MSLDLAFISLIQYINCVPILLVSHVNHDNTLSKTQNGLRWWMINEQQKQSQRKATEWLVLAIIHENNASAIKD